MGYALTYAPSRTWSDFTALRVNIGAASDQPRMQRQAEKVLADGLVNRKLRLRLLRHRVHVAEPALERMVRENRHGAGGKVGGLRDLPRLLAQMDRRHAQPHPLVERHRAGHRGAPDVLPGGK